MGDHRAECHITFRIHGKTYQGDWDWINWSGHDDGIDYRVREWFQECWSDAYSRYQDMVDEARKRDEAPIIEKAEREQLAELKAKYEK